MLTGWTPAAGHATLHRTRLPRTPALNAMRMHSGAAAHAADDV